MLEYLKFIVPVRGLPGNNVKRQVSEMMRKSPILIVLFIGEKTAVKIDCVI